MTSKSKRILTVCLLVVLCVGCTRDILHKEPREVEEAAKENDEVAVNPRVVASLQLTDQGRRLLEAGKPDKAIRMLEQAVSLNPVNGQNYYYLSEAWLMKGSAAQAKEFNHLAEIHLKDDEAWMIKVAQQADRITELEK
jgi:predicted Zn-dependent protease